MNETFDETFNAAVEARMAEWQASEEREWQAICRDLDDKFAWEMVASPAMLRRLFELSGWPVFCPLMADVGHIGTFSEDTTPPLHLRIKTSADGDCGEEVVIHEVDVIGDLIGAWGDPSKDESSRAAFDRAYAALQGGIDRLRAYEAECLQAQS